MSKKKTIRLLSSDGLLDIENALSVALEQLEETNMRIEELLQAHAKVDANGTLSGESNEIKDGQDDTSSVITSDPTDRPAQMVNETKGRKRT